MNKQYLSKSIRLKTKKTTLLTKKILSKTNRFLAYIKLIWRILSSLTIHSMTTDSCYQEQLKKRF